MDLSHTDKTFIMGLEGRSLVLLFKGSMVLEINSYLKIWHHVDQEKYLKDTTNYCIYIPYNLSPENLALHLNSNQLNLNSS